MIPPRYTHQQQSLDFMQTTDRIFDMSDVGCVDKDTEFLTPTGWKKIIDYNPEQDLVAEVNPTTLQIQYAKPLEYVVAYCQQFIRFAPARGVHMNLSPEHRVLYYPHDGKNRQKRWKVCSAAEFETNPTAKSIAVTFIPPDNSGLLLNEAQLRVMVAVIADGYFPCNTSRCTIRIKKVRKIERLRQLLQQADIPYDEKQCGGADPDYHAFRFEAPRREKVFTSVYWNASNNQLQVVTDEVFHWDGSKEKIFTTIQKESADFVQYAIAACGYPTSCSSRYREEKGHTEYTVIKRDRLTPFVGNMRRDSITRFRPKDGRKYCFTTNTSFWLARCDGYIFVTGNTGKSRSQIDAIATRPDVDKTLIIAPKSILVPAWANDFAKFAPEYRVSVARAENREKAFKQDADIYVTNTDAVTWIVKQNPKLLDGFNNLVIDESEHFKHRTSNRSKALAKIAKSFKYRSLLSATPSDNGVLDLWHQAFLLDGGATLGTNFFGFRSQACEPKQVGPSANHLQWKDKEGIYDVVTTMLSPMTIRHKLEECLDIPQNHEYTVTFDLSPKSRKAYDQMLKLGMTMLENGQILDATQASVVSTKLRQIASGAGYLSAEGLSEEDPRTAVIDTERYDLVAELAHQVDHSIIFFEWRHQREGIQKALERLGVSYGIIDGSISQHSRDDLVTAYQMGLVDTILIHPQSGAHGLTLTRGRRVIWATPVYKASTARQGMGRIYRSGQTKKTETIVVIARDTIDEHVYANQKSRQNHQNDLLDMLQGYFKSAME